MLSNSPINPNLIPIPRKESPMNTVNSLRISASIRSYRRERSMSQTSFGELFGVSAQAVSKWERELSCPDITLLPEIARVLGVSIAYLLGAES